MQEYDRKVSIQGGSTTQAKITSSARIYDILCEKLYTDLPFAVCREIFSNAEESRKAAGVSTPTEITLPTFAKPFLVIKDYGLGMSKEFIEQKFMNFAESEKLEHFGLGAKVVFGFSEVTKLISIKDGKKHIFSLMKNENSIPVAIHHDSVDTSEPNGVTFEILVNYRYFNVIEEDISRLVLYASNPIKVNNDLQVPATPIYEGVVEDVKWKIYSETISGLTVENIPYIVHKNYNTGQFWQLLRNVCVEVPPSKVSITPSRDALSNNALNKSLYALTSSILKNIKETVEKDFGNKTIYEKTVLAKKLHWLKFNDPDLTINWSDYFDLEQVNLYNIKWSSTKIRDSTQSRSPNDIFVFGNGPRALSRVKAWARKNYTSRIFLIKPKLKKYKKDVLLGFLKVSEGFQVKPLSDFPDTKQTTTKTVSRASVSDFYFEVWSGNKSNKIKGSQIPRGSRYVYSNRDVVTDHFALQIWRKSTDVVVVPLTYKKIVQELNLVSVETGLETEARKVFNKLRQPYLDSLEMDFEKEFPKLSKLELFGLNRLQTTPLKHPIWRKAFQRKPFSEYSLYNKIAQKYSLPLPVPYNGVKKHNIQLLMKHLPEFVLLNSRSTPDQIAYLEKLLNERTSNSGPVNNHNL